MKFEKFREESKRTKMSEGMVYLLRKLQATTDELHKILKQRTRHFVRFTGTYTTVGGDTTEEISIPGVRPYMKCHVSVHTLGATRTHVIAHRCDVDKVIVELQGDPGNDHVLEYIISN